MTWEPPRENEYLCIFHGEAPQHHGKASQKNFSREIFSRGASPCEKSFPSYSLAEWK